MAFCTPITIQGHRHCRRPSLSLRIPRCQASRPQKATLFTTGEKLSLHQAPPSSPSTPRYILCPQCHSAYIGNAITAIVRVACPSCNDVFRTSPIDLYVVAPAEAPPPPLPNSIVCSHMKSCSGCTLSKNIDNPPMLADARRFISDVLRLPSPPTVEVGPTHQWRTHAKLAARRGTRGERLVLGLFKSHSHDVLQIPGCAVHALEIEEAVQLITSVLVDGSVTPYEEATGKGLIRYVLFTVERSSRLVQVTLVWNKSNWKDSSPDAQKIGAELWRRGHKTLHSVWFNWNTTGGNAIVNPETERYYHMFGERNLVEHVRGVQVTFPPYVFRQANLDAFEKLILPRLLQYIPDGANVAEFCAGVGVIGLVALKHRRLYRLTASELHHGAEDEFWKAVTKLRRAAVRADVNFVVGSDEDTIDMLTEDIDVAIFDPPRAGLSGVVVENLATIDSACALESIIYLSCGFSAFKKDARGFCRTGQWKLSAAHFYVLFPGSDQLETLAVFKRMRPDTRSSSYTRDAYRSNSSYVQRTARGNLPGYNGRRKSPGTNQHSRAHERTNEGTKRYGK